jgi:hypothetical protein
MIISHKHKFIFFACGKTGTHSIEAVMDKYHDGQEFIQQVDQELETLRRKHSCPYTLKHVRPAFVRKLIDPQIWDTYYKFVFVRNPWDWVLSNFCFNNKHLVKHLHSFDTVHVNAVWHLMKVHNQSPYTESYFQHTFVYDEDGKMMVDYFGKLESFQDDFNYICSRIGLDPEPLQKKNPTAHLHYKNLYTMDARNLVEELYKPDIELLNYEF